MATRFVNVDRDTPMLLPPDLREWVPEDDMVHFVIEAVAEMNLPTAIRNPRKHPRIGVSERRISSPTGCYLLRIPCRAF